MKAGIVLSLVLSAIAHAGDLPILPGAEIRMVADGFKFTEGPASDANGDVYFTDQPNDRIMKWSAVSGAVTTFLQPCGRANGLYFDRQGFLIACADEKGLLQRINPKTKEVTTLVDGFGGELLNGPNDVWVRPDGGMYFTDPFYKRPYWQGRDEPAQSAQRVYFLGKQGAKPVVADDDFNKPNGIIGTPDGQKLYVADIGAGKTYVYQVAMDGSLGGRRVFCEQGSDGMTLDSEGNLYLTGKGVAVFDRNGGWLGTIAVPRTHAANVTFGGPERKTLFITAMDAVFTLEMRVRGAE